MVRRAGPDLFRDVTWHGSVARGVPRVLVLATVAAALDGCVGTTDGSARDVVAVPLQPARIVAGEVGQAHLMPQGDGTRVRVEVSGVPMMLSSRPIHLYTFIYEGNCGNLGAQPAYALLDRVLAQSTSGRTSAGGPFTISNTAPLPLATLRSGTFALVVRTSPADGNRELFCGEIR